MSIPGLRISETDDEFFGSLQSQSNLANVFGVNEKKDEFVNKSLKYKPIKPASASENVVEGDSAATAWNVQVAKVVTAFKLINQENISQGRVGLALLKNFRNDFKIIVYRSKSNVLAKTTLGAGRKLTIQSSYLQFHDDEQFFWSILLESKDEKSFTEHLPHECLSTIENLPEIPGIVDKQPETISFDDDNNSKAKLLSRMAKMGQPLPKLASPPTATDVSDFSDTELTIISPKPSIAPRKVGKEIVPAGNSLQTGRIVFDPQVQENCYMNMLLTENRTQNTELRINISKLDSKIEKVLDKIDLMGSKELPSNERDRDDEILYLEEKILELRRDNRSLRQRAREIETKKGDGRRESKLREDLFGGYEDVLEYLGVSLNDCAGLEEFTMDILQKSRSVLSNARDEAKKKDSKLDENEAEICKFKQENSKLNEATRSFQSQVNIVSKQCELLKQQLDCAQSDKNNKFQSSVKQIMNNIYGEIVQGLDAINGQLTAENVLKVCASAIRKESLNVLKEN